MANLDITAITPALKQMYPDNVMKDLVYANNPFFAMVKKNEQMFGELTKVPLIYGNPLTSSTFSNALSNKSPSKLKAFLVTRAKDYSLANIETEALLASSNDKGAFLNGLQMEMDGVIKGLGRSISKALYGSGSGSLGQVANSSFATTTLTLGASTTSLNPESVVNFEVGMILKVSATDGGGSVRAGSLTVVGIDRDAGTLTTSANLSTGIAAIAQGDYIFVEGDYDAKLKGLAGWIPFTAPTSTLFYSVDRTADVSRLAGIRQDGSTKPIEEALTDVAARIGREGGTPTHCFMGFGQYANLVKALGSKVMYSDIKVTPEVGFSSVIIDGPKGKIQVVPDHNCPNSYAWMLQLDTWTLGSMKGAPHILDYDQKMIRDSSADAYEIRCGFYGALYTNAPGFNGIVKLS